MGNKQLPKYEVEFWDHSVGKLGGMGEIRCRIVGYLIEESERYLKFTFWSVDTEDHEMWGHNLEPFSIMKAAIIRKRRLK